MSTDPKNNEGMEMLAMVAAIGMAFGGQAPGIRWPRAKRGNKYRDGHNANVSVPPVNRVRRRLPGNRRNQICATCGKKMKRCACPTSEAPR